MDTKLIRNINRQNFSRAKEKDFENTKVYKVDGDTQVLHYWNSSNSSEPKHNLSLENIMDEILDEVDSGSVSDGWNEIMFEVEYK